MIGWIYLAATLLIVFFLLRNIIADSNYRQQKKDGIFVFDDTRPSHKYSRIFFMVLGVLIAGVSIYLMAKRRIDFELITGAICLISGCILFAFFPYSQARWVLKEDGMFLYNYNIFLPWEDIINIKNIGQGKKSFLMIYLRESSKDALKKKNYPVMVLPAERTSEIHNMIREFIAVEDKRRNKRRLEALKAIREEEKQYYQDK